MKEKNREFQRFDDIGRFFSQQICALPGILENISREGCKIRYQVPIALDMDGDYEAKITFARAASEGNFVLLCHPQWKAEKEGFTEVGFKILPSTDFSRLGKYIEQLDVEHSKNPLYEELSDSSCQII